MGATSQELSRALPGDDEVALPSFATTRATTIHAPAGTVWPWLVQMGWRRAGWYSYDAIDNDHVPSADHIIPALQVDLHVGDFIPEGADVGWSVTAVEPGHLLLLTTHGPWPVSTGSSRDSSWLFLIEEIDSEHSRLIERARTAIKGNNSTLLGALASKRVARPGLAVGDFVMAHRHMKGIKRRAEHEFRTTRSSRHEAVRRLVGIVVGTS